MQENAKHTGVPCDFVSVVPVCELQPQAPRRPILRRDPSSSILHRILERHAPAFWAACEQRGRHYPPFVQRQLSSFARCGDPAHGFARIYCPHCRREEFLAFSCKVRQLCPCCCARRMNAQAAHLVDHVLPAVPLRQWVLTVPFEIRALLAFDPKLLSLLRRIYVQETLRFFEAQLASTGVHQPRGGAVNFAHRVDGALRINPHFHTLVLDGAYDNATRPQFHELSQLSLSDLESILSRIIARFVRALRRRGLLPASGDSNQDIEIPEELAQLAASVSAAVQQGSALGQGGEWITELGKAEASDFKIDSEHHSVRLHGFSLYASPSVAACATASRERLARYIARPPIAESRLSVMADGYILLRLKRRFRNGIHSVRLHPFAFIERLCTMLPRPRRHELTYHGVLASGSQRRPQVIPKPTPRSRESDLPPRCRASQGCTKIAKSVPAPRESKKPGARSNPYIHWPTLMQRCFDIDVLLCPHCLGRRRIIAFLEDPVVVHQILSHCGLLESGSDPPLPVPAELF
jgi:hypothetical protein